MPRFIENFPNPESASSNSENDEKIEDIKKAEEMAYAEKPFRDIISEKDLTPEQKQFLEELSQEKSQEAGEKYDKLKQEKESKIIETITETVKRSLQFFDKYETQRREEELNINEKELKEEVEAKIHNTIDSLIEQGKTPSEIFDEINNGELAHLNTSLQEGYFLFKDMCFSKSFDFDRYFEKQRETFLKLAKDDTQSEKQKALIKAVASNKIKTALYYMLHTPNKPFENYLLEGLKDVGENPREYIKDHISLFSEKRKVSEYKSRIDELMRKYRFLWSDKEQSYISIE